MIISLSVFYNAISEIPHLSITWFAEKKGKKTKTKKEWSVMLKKSLVNQRLTCALYLLTLLYYTVQRKEIPERLPW